MASAGPGERTGSSAPAGARPRLARARARAAGAAQRARERAAGAAERARERAAGAAERARSGAVGSVQTQMRDLAISHHALVFSALGMVLFVPALISLATLLPLGSEHGLAARMAHHMALSAEARKAVRDLFSTGDTIRTPTSAVGAVFTVLAAYAWPAELQRFYEAVWGLPSLGWRHLWRPLVWLGSLVVVLVVVAVVGALAGGVAGALLTGALCSPLVLLWLWWVQRLLLARRVPWRALLPGALVTAVGLAGFSVVTSVYLSRAIIWNADRYGPIGVVFVLMSWLTWFSTVLLGGSVVGRILHMRRTGSSG
jgi:membrane protein